MSDEIKNYIPTYYVYLLVDPRNNLPFYVGKGTGNRVKQHYQSCRLDTSNPRKNNKIKKLKQLGYKPKWEIIFETESEQEALKEETNNILKWGRKGIEKEGILTNFKIQGVSSVDGTVSKKVDQYDRFGNFIQTFCSCRAAAKSCGGSRSSDIAQSCRKKSKNKTAYGFYWTWHGIPLDFRWCFGRKKFVYQWDLNGEFVSMYNSKSSAAKSCGVKHQSIFKAIRIKGSAGGFQWTTKNTSPGKYKAAIGRRPNVVSNNL